MSMFEGDLKPKMTFLLYYQSFFEVLVSVGVFENCWFVD